MEEENIITVRNRNLHLMIFGNLYLRKRLNDLYMELVGD